MDNYQFDTGFLIRHACWIYVNQDFSPVKMKYRNSANNGWIIQAANDLIHEILDQQVYFNNEHPIRIGPSGSVDVFTANQRMIRLTFKHRRSFHMSNLVITADDFRAIAKTTNVLF